MQPNETWSSVAGDWPAQGTEQWDLSALTASETVSLGLQEDLLPTRLWQLSDTLGLSAVELQESLLSQGTADTLTLGMLEGVALGSVILGGDLLNFSLVDVLEVLVDDWPQSGSSPGSGWGQAGAASSSWVQVEGRSQNWQLTGN